MALYNLSKIRLKIPYGQIAYSTGIFKKSEYKKCYHILGVPESSDQEEIRRAYLMLVKQYHPDNVNGDIAKFHEIDKAFRTLMDKKSRERWDAEDDLDGICEQDIKHTAPQHRQYLSYDGIGAGTPFQRQKEYTKVRAMQATENVLQHRISKVTAEENALMQKVPLKHKIKTKYGFDRLVEDLIQEAMSKGEFNNLSGCGKPLKGQDVRNPYVDFVTHKLNEILIENGFTPEWIMLQKEIREELKILKDGLSMERQYFGANPLTAEENDSWKDAVCKYEELANGINKKISKYNLVVPILDKQMFLVTLSVEAQKVLKNGKSNLDGNFKKVIPKSENVAPASATTNIFGLFDMFFRK